MACAGVPRPLRAGSSERPSPPSPPRVRRSWAEYYGGRLIFYYDDEAGARAGQIRGAVNLKDAVLRVGYSEPGLRPSFAQPKEHVEAPHRMLVVSKARCVEGRFGAGHPGVAAIRRFFLLSRPLARVTDAERAGVAAPCKTRARTILSMLFWRRWCAAPVRKAVSGPT